MFVNHLCVKCGYHGALFVFDSKYVAPCPKCVSERIADLRREGHPIPTGVAWKEGQLTDFEKLAILENEARREVIYQDKKEQGTLQVSFDDMVKCASCGKLILMKDGRAFFPEGGMSSPSYCIDCHSRMVRGQ